MDRRAVIKRMLILLTALCLTLTLTGCRTRTGSGAPDPASSSAVSGTGDAEHQGGYPSDAAITEVPSENVESGDEEAGGRKKENPDASRKEYDENASAEVVPGTDRLLHEYGEGDGAAAVADEETPEAVSRLNEKAEEKAVQTAAAPEAEEKGAAEDAEQAESAMTYFTVLLQDRMGSLFECQRANVYWETAEDHVTVHKTSKEHELILNAGAYDVSTRLLAENLKVDDGWVVRKNPQVIVKIVDSNVLGSRVYTAGTANAVYQTLCAREGWAGIDAVRNRKVLLLSVELLEAPYLKTAAMLMIAKTANPDVLADVDPDEALRMLTEEAAGTLPAGIYYYLGGA